MEMKEGMREVVRKRGSRRARKGKRAKEAELTLKTGTFPKKLENLSASIVADVTSSFRSFLRDTT